MFEDPRHFPFWFRCCRVLLNHKPQLVNTSSLGYRCHIMGCDPTQSEGNNQASDEMPSVRRVRAAFKSYSYDGKSTFQTGKNTEWGF